MKKISYGLSRHTYYVSYLLNLFHLCKKTLRKIIMFNNLTVKAIA
jgi:hypothetical protein